MTGTLPPLLESVMGGGTPERRCLRVLMDPNMQCPDGFSDQGVIQVRIITLKKDHTNIPTKHPILTFNSPKLPSTIKAGYLNCKIRPYVPNPVRCFKCQRFDHTQTSCRGQLTCSRCASVGHSSPDCTLEPKCVNCTQSHPSDSKICPKWKLEKQIQEIKANKYISDPEARKLIAPHLSQTYSQAAKSSTLNNSTQTDKNITKVKCPPLNFLQPLPKPVISISTPSTSTSSSTQVHLLPSTSTAATVSEPLSTTSLSLSNPTFHHQYHLPS
ncbi:putative RNA-directed DNA polymerase from transposon X-element [Trichonephila clavipes]|nr:putative RNA-directed DNA polymerase from transposon X-element [Trichonephila clavipes]